VKTRKAIRKIYLVPELEPILKKYFRSHHSINEVVHTRTVAYHIVKKVAKKAGIKTLYPHSLRGTFATIMYEKGYKTLEIRDILGWESFETANLYMKSRMSKEEFHQKWLER